MFGHDYSFLWKAPDFNEYLINTTKLWVDLLKKLDRYVNEISVYTSCSKIRGLYAFLYHSYSKIQNTTLYGH